MKRIQSLLTLFLLSGLSPLLGMQAALSFAKVPKIAVTVQATQQEIIQENPHSIIDRVRSDIEQSRQRSTLIRQLAQASSQFLENFLTFTRLLQPSIVNRVYDFTAIKSHFTFYKDLRELPAVLIPAEQQFIVDLIQLLTDASGAYQGITSENQSRVIDLLISYYYTFCNDSTQFQEKMSQLASQYSYCRSLLTNGKKLSYRYIPDAKNIQRKFEKCISRFESHPYNKQLFKIIDCLGKNDVDGARKLQRDFVEENRNNLKLNQAQKNELKPVSAQQRAAYEDGLKLAARLEEIINAHVGADKKGFNRAVGFDDQFVQYEKARKFREQKMGQLQKDAAILKNLIPQARLLVDLALQEIEKQSANSRFFEQLLNYLSTIAHDASCDDTLCVLEGTQVPRELCRYESTVLEKILAYVQDVNDPALTTQKADLKHNLLQLVTMWNNARKYPTEYKSVIQSFYAHCTKDKEKIPAKNTDTIAEQKTAKPADQLPRSQSIPINLAQTERLEADFNRKKAMDADQASTDMVKTGPESAENRDKYSCTEKSVLEARVIAGAFSAEANANPRTQEIIYQSVQLIKDRTSNLETYDKADSEDMINKKLEQRVEIGMEEFRRSARELNTQEEVWSLFNEIMDTVDSEYKAIFPGMHKVAVEHFCNSLGLSTDIKTWNSDNLLRAGSILFQKNARNIKHTVTFIPQVVYSALRTGYDWLSGNRDTASILNGSAQLYYVWTSLSPYQQKTLVTKFLVDQAIEAPSSFGIIKYGGTVARSMRQMMATGARAAAGRMTSSPLWVGFRNRLASIEHAKPGHIGVGNSLSWSEFLPKLRALEGEFGKEIMSEAIEISKLTESNILKRTNVIGKLRNLACDLKVINSNPRWKTFKFDPDKGRVTHGSIFEAKAAITAEKNGITGVLQRADRGFDFVEEVDGMRKYWDVKSAICYSFNELHTLQVTEFIDSINKQLLVNGVEILLDLGSACSKDVKLIKEAVDLLPVSMRQRIAIVESYELFRS